MASLRSQMRMDKYTSEASLLQAFEMTPCKTESQQAVRRRRQNDEDQRQRSNEKDRKRLSETKKQDSLFLNANGEVRELWSMENRCEP